MDKHALKAYLKKAGILHADFVHFKQIKHEEIEAKVKEVESKIKHYPMFGKPTNLDTARCTSKIHNQNELRQYFIYTMEYPQLEFMIETFLEGKHYQIEAIVKEGKISYDMVMHYPNPCQSALFGLPLGSYMMPFDSIEYLKAHEALEKLISIMPHIYNTTIFFEFVFMQGEVYVMEACKRKAGLPCMIFYKECTGINFEEAYFKLSVNNLNFYIAEPRTFTKNVGYVMYMKKTGIVAKQNEFPPLQSKITEFQLSKLGEASQMAQSHQKRDKSMLVFLENEDHVQLAKEIQEMLLWEPFEYSSK